MSFTTLTVSVPVGKEAELLQFAAALATAPEDAGDDAEEVVNGERSQRRWGWGRQSVMDSYYGGVSDAWRPFLDYLAERPDEWVAWPDLYDHIGMTAQQASGMLGAAERRCGGRPPYEKQWRQRVRYFRMPASVAAIVSDLRED